MSLASNWFKVGILLFSLTHLGFVLVPFLDVAVLVGVLDQLVFNGLVNIFIEIFLEVLHPELEVVLPSWLKVRFRIFND